MTMPPEVNVDASRIFDDEDGKVFDTGQCKEAVY
jgi:hypothetical protein